MNNLDTIRATIIARRKLLKLTQDQLATASGLGVATIKRFELGQHWPQMEHLAKLCDALGCSIAISAAIP